VWRDIGQGALFFNARTVRLAREDHAQELGHPLAHKPPFRLEGTHNVILETIKRGEDDINLPKKKKRTGSTIILRLYEAYGGQGTTRLRIASHLEVKKAWIANLLEDGITRLTLEKEAEETIIPLCLRGFELLTIKLVISSVGHECE
jgi:alpha-mannosidase